MQWPLQTRDERSKVEEKRQEIGPHYVAVESCNFLVSFCRCQKKVFFFYIKEVFFSAFSSLIK